MGQLLSAIRGMDPGFELDLSPPPPAPSPEDPAEAEIYATMASWLSESGKSLTKIRAYDRNADLLSMAMSAPKDVALQEKAFSSLLPNIEVIKGFFDLSNAMTTELPKLLQYLAGRDLTQHEALAKQLADVLDFIIQFDYEKMMKTALQNDFSYYRRHFGKMGQLPGVTVQEAEANLISLFMAKNLPFMITLETIVKGILSASPERGQRVLISIGLLANVMASMAAKKDTAEDTRRYCLRVMTSAIVLYDRVNVPGVFARGSVVNTRRCLRVLYRAQGGPASSLAQQLQSSIKFWTLHYKDANTPTYVSSYLGD